MDVILHDQLAAVERGVEARERPQRQRRRLDEEGNHGQLGTGCGIPVERLSEGLNVAHVGFVELVT